MSGGVIKKYATKTLVKVRFERESKWYECLVPVFVGDCVLAEIGGEERWGMVEEVLSQVTADKSPVPFSGLREILQVKE